MSKSTGYPRYVIYKPRKDGKGCACQFELNTTTRCVFLNMALQSGTNAEGYARFDWANKRIAKLNEVEMGDIVRVIRIGDGGIGPWDETSQRPKGLFHKTNTGSTTLQFARSTHGYHLRMAIQTRGSEGLVVLQQGVTDAEAETLSIFLQQAVQCLLGFWNPDHRES